MYFNISEFSSKKLLPDNHSLIDELGK